jgi:hypothetical protein
MAAVGDIGQFVNGRFMVKLIQELFTLRDVTGEAMITDQIVVFIVVRSRNNLGPDPIAILALLFDLEAGCDVVIADLPDFLMMGDFLAD